MTPEIKQRIEQIKNSEIPKGYKHSKVGIIPEDWEVLRLKDKFDRLSRKNSEGNTNVLTISAQYGLINQEEFFKKEIASDDKSNYYLLHRGEFAYNKSYSNGYPFGAIKRLSRYDKGVVSPLYICFSANNNNACPEYYEQYFEAGRLNHEIQAYAQEGARNHGLMNISVIDFFNSKIIVPPIAEQKRIAKILSAQDKVIECYEKKIEQLKRMKKYYLQNMFPKRGETVPKIRFKGFTEPWEQHKVGNLLIERNEQAPQSKEYPLMAYVANEGVVPKGERYDRSALVNDTINKFYKRTELDDFIYSSNNLESGSIGLNKYGKASISPVYSIFYSSNLSDPNFIGHRLIKNDFIYEMVKYRQGVIYGQWRIHESDFKKISILVPILAEQKVIGSFFDYLDRQITILQKNYEEEKKKKKALQQLLLTGVIRTN